MPVDNDVFYISKTKVPGNAISLLWIKQLTNFNDS